MVHPSRPMKERFWEKVDKHKDDECWLWTGVCSGSGYGQLKDWPIKKMISVHRYSYELHKGLIPKGLDVCHECNNRKCVNPSHLYVGTRRKNIEQAINQGRFSCGENHYNAKLTNDKVREIRKMLSNGTSVVVIARHFSVSEATIASVRNGVSWRHVKNDNQSA